MSLEDFRITFIPTHSNALKVWNKLQRQPQKCRNEFRTLIGIFSFASSGSYDDLMSSSYCQNNTEHCHTPSKSKRNDIGFRKCKQTNSENDFGSEYFVVVVVCVDSRLCIFFCARERFLVSRCRTTRQQEIFFTIFSHPLTGEDIFPTRCTPNVRIYFEKSIGKEQFVYC